MPISSVWDRIADAGPAAVVLVGATLALLALPILRWLAPRSRRHRGGPARLFLGLAILLALSAIGVGTMGAASPGNILQLISLLTLILGLVGMGGLLVFDVVLPRLRIDDEETAHPEDRKSTRLNSSHVRISHAVFCLQITIQHNHDCLAAYIDLD